MNIHNATEQAYKRGYEDGLKDAVKHGRWHRGQCTNCKAINPVYKKDWNGDYIFEELNYCPICGAKMDLE